MALIVGRTHLGPRSDQLLDHGGVAAPSRPMQRRVASAHAAARLAMAPPRRKNRNGKRAEPPSSFWSLAQSWSYWDYVEISANVKQFSMV